MPQSKTRTARYDAEMLGQRNNEELWQLRWHWGDSDDGPYRISVTFPYGWRAVRADASPEDIAKETGVLTAESSAELRGKMMADYTARPVAHSDV